MKDNKIINWLIEGPVWLKYAVEKQLLNLRPDSTYALQDIAIKKIIHRLQDNQVGIPAIKTGNVSYLKTGNAYWDLFFLADIGLTIDDIKLYEEVEGLLSLQISDGGFITEKYIKSNYFCISSILISSLVKIGYKNDIRIKKYIQVILDSQRLDNGWHCAKRRAKGQKLQDTESCPMDNLNILNLLSHYEDCRNDKILNGAIDLLLIHWGKRENKYRIYGFGIGDEFNKLKYPATKYGILRVLDVLSLFPYAVKNDNFKNMLEFVKTKASNGKYVAESVVNSYSEFDFGQKKEPSRWITFIINKIENQIKM